MKIINKIYCKSIEPRTETAKRNIVYTYTLEKLFLYNNMQNDETNINKFTDLYLKILDIIIYQL